MDHSPTNTPKTSAGPGAFMVVEEHQQQKSHTTNVTPYVLLGAGWLGDCVANILATTLGWDSRMDERPPPVQKRSSRYTELTLLLLLLLHGACVFGHDSNMHTDELGDLYSVYRANNVMCGAGDDDDSD